MRQPPFLLDRASAEIVLRSIRNTCAYRDWTLLAAHVRTNHVHIVVDGIPSPSIALRDLKAYATRSLGQGRIRWSRHASTRPLPDARAVAGAVNYVIAYQGDPMAVYCATSSRE